LGSIADTIVLAGNVGVEQAAKQLVSQLQFRLLPVVEMLLMKNDRC
jgi:catalase (peroxidase I)